MFALEVSIGPFSVYQQATEISIGADFNFQLAACAAPL